MEALFELFQTRAQAVSAEVHRFALKSEALDFIAGFLESQTTGTPDLPMVWADGPYLDAPDRERMRNRLPSLTFEVTREGAASAAAGVSEVEWAIANTGTLAADFTRADRRLASTLPPIHVVLAPTGAIQPDLPSLFKRLHPLQSNYISLITGPSRTADIERVLTIGVHGPKRLIIVFADEIGRVA
jgi:L-lactate dehydrogenase complex protein LldG